MRCAVEVYLMSKALAALGLAVFATAGFLSLAEFSDWALKLALAGILPFGFFWAMSFRTAPKSENR